MPNKKSQKRGPTPRRGPGPGPGPRENGGAAAGWGRWILPVALLLLLLAFVSTGVGNEGTRIPYSEFKRQVEAGNVKSVEAEGESLWGRLRQPVEVDVPARGRTPAGRRTVAEFRTTLPPFGDEQLMAQLEAANAELVSHGAGSQWLSGMLMALVPLALFVGVWILLMRRAGRQLGGYSAITKSRAKLFSLERPHTTFDDVAGAHEAKTDLKQVIEFLKNAGPFRRLGCSVPKGVLLVGQPGTGKTLLARAVAGEAGVPFYSITGSDFMEMFVGVGAARVRDLFEAAKRSSPCIIFLDELDSVGRRRGTGIGGGHDEREQTLNQLLSEMDGFEENENIVVMAATNRPDILDPALMRPGRFDRRIVVDMPNLSDRRAILDVHTRRVPLDANVDLAVVARGTPGMSGADLKNLVNEAALLAAKGSKLKVDASDFSEARDKVLMGSERESLHLSDEERHAVAHHEAGHALVAFLTPHSDPVHKVTIIPRGQALGVTQQLPTDERHNYPRNYLMAKLKVLLAGRAAEVAVLGSVTTGAENDLVQATTLARKMVTSWGMSDRIGNVAIEDRSGNIFLGEQLAQRRAYSEQTAREVDIEVKRLVDEAFDGAVDTIEENRNGLEILAEALEQREVLEGKDIEELLLETGAPREREAVPV